MYDGEVVKRWEVVEFNWGCGVKDRYLDKWTNIFFKPNSIELDVENMSVELHDNGVEFL